MSAVSAVPDGVVTGRSGEVGLLPVERLEAEIYQGAADIGAATARWLVLVGEYNRRRAYESWECLSMAQWLVGHLGISVITARQYVQVAETLPNFPILRAAFESGELAYSRVRALCRVITTGQEQELVDLARHLTAPQLERFVAGVARCTAQGDVASAAAAWDRRRLSIRFDEDGSCVVSARLNADQGAALRRAVELDVGRHERDPHDSFEQRRADALIRLIAAGHERLETTNSDNAESDDGTDREVRPLVIVHRYPDGDELQGGPAIPGVVAERLLCEGDRLEAIHRQTTHAKSPHNNSTNDTSGKKAAVFDESVVYGRKRRHRTAAQFRALLDRDQGCRFKGCASKNGLHAHHLRRWVDGGLTVTSEMVLLCHRHHTAVHDRGWTIVGNPAGELLFVPPNQRIPTPTLSIGLDTATGSPRVMNYGDRFDLGLTIGTFLDNEHNIQQEHARQQARAKDQQTRSERHCSTDDAAASSTE
jgi:hypothetical protein